MLLIGSSLNLELRTQLVGHQRSSKDLSTESNGRAECAGRRRRRTVARCLREHSSRACAPRAALTRARPRAASGASSKGSRRSRASRLGDATTTRAGSAAHGRRGPGGATRQAAGGATRPQPVARPVRQLVARPVPQPVSRPVAVPVARSVATLLATRFAQLALIFVVVTILTLAMSIVAQAFR